MRFFHNKIINASAAPDPQAWDRWVENFLKTAREAKPGTGIEGDGEKDPRNQGKGQVINNDNDQGAGQSYQDGESVKGKKPQGGNARPDKGGETSKSDNKQNDKEASCGKEMGESSDAGKVTEKHTPAGPGNDKNPNPKILINNDPNYQKGESVNMKKKEKGKKAEFAPFKKIASLNRNEKVTLIAQLGLNKSYPIEYIEAVAGLKIANLTAEEKEELKTFWSILEPDDYVEKMLKDR